MALTSVGPDIKLKRLAGGKFDFDVSTSGTNKGNPLMDSSRAHSVVQTIFARKRGRAPGDKMPSGGYYWDTAGTRGTLLWTVTQDRQSTRSQLIAAAQDGLAQLVDQRLIAGFEQPEAQRLGLGLGRWFLTIQWRTPSADGLNPPLKVLL